MFRVEELFFVERDHAWAVALRPDQPGQRLSLGAVLVSGLRRWKVAELHDAPAGLVGARLDGGEALTRGLILRPIDEPMGAAEYKAGAVLLVRLARACRHIDLDGLLARVGDLRARGAIGEIESRVVAKTAVLVGHLIEHGATAEELNAAAAAFGIKDEV